MDSERIANVKVALDEEIEDTKLDLARLVAARAKLDAPGASGGSGKRAPQGPSRPRKKPAGPKPRKPGESHIWKKCQNPQCGKESRVNCGRTTCPECQTKKCLVKCPRPPAAAAGDASAETS